LLCPFLGSSWPTASGRVAPCGEDETILVIRDVTASRRTEERWQLVLRGNNDGIWDWDLATNQTFYSARWKAMLGFSDNELLNHHGIWDRLVHPDDRDWVTAAVQDNLAGKTPYYSAEYRMRCKAEVIRNAIERQLIPHDASPVARYVTASIGCTATRASAELSHRTLR